MKSVERTRQSGTDALLAGKVMEHQHPLAETSGAHLEAGAVGGERVGAEGPCAGVIRLGRVRVVLAVVEDHLEHPAGVLDL